MARCYSDAERLDKIKAYFVKHGRVPKESEFRDGFSQFVRNSFGSWEKAVRLATGQSANMHYWTDEEILKLLESLNKKHGRYPRWEDIRAVKKSLNETIRARFGGLAEALEKAIGDSPRVQILYGLWHLTPPGCDKATTSEIRTMLMSRNIALSVAKVALELNRCRDQGLVTGGQMGKRAYWTLTMTGRKHIRRFGYGNSL